MASRRSARWRVRLRRSGYFRIYVRGEMRPRISALRERMSPRKADKAYRMEMERVDRSRARFNEIIGRLAALGAKGESDG